MNEPDLYIKIYDSEGNFVHETNPIGNPFTPYIDPEEKNQTECVVVGSGFGGTILSLSLVNKYHDEDNRYPTPTKEKL